SRLGDPIQRFPLGRPASDRDRPPIHRRRSRGGAAPSRPPGHRGAQPERGGSRSARRACGAGEDALLLSLLDPERSLSQSPRRGPAHGSPPSRYDGGGGALAVARAVEHRSLGARSSGTDRALHRIHDELRRDDMSERNEAGEELPPNIGPERLINACGYSLAGLASAWRTEGAFRQELMAAVILIPIACLAAVPMVERVLLI